jgi:hypothetical protein
MRSLTLLVLLPACSWVAQAEWDHANDRDGDGYLTSVNGGDDCDDGDPNANPAATERCNGRDDDCDGEIDEADAADASTWYPDADGDSYGDASQGTTACVGPEGHIDQGGDCDDGDAAINPSADEHCDGVDEDCDGDIDDDAVDSPDWYRDDDGDGYGVPLEPLQACEQPSGYADNADDCDDSDDSIHPEAAEWCDGVDTDCDGSDDPSDIVSFADLSGTYSDATASFQSKGSAAVYEFDADGTLYFCPGSYTGLISISAASASIVGRDGADSTVLSGASDGTVISATSGATDLNLTGLTITDGYAAHGGGIHLDGLTIDLQDLHIDSNLATEQGGGLFAKDCSGIASDLRISGNESRGDGGGLYLEGTILTLSGSQVSDNQSDGNGGGMLAIGRATELSVTATLVHDNQADSGGGLFLEDAVVSCNGDAHAAEGFHANVALSDGGGVAVNGNHGSFVSRGCDFGADDTNNAPDDIFTTKWSEPYWYADDADFECDNTSCW